MLKELTQKTQFKKAVAMLLVFTLTFAYWLTLGEVIATSIADEAIVNFDAYFEVGTEKVHEVSPKLGEEVVLNLEVEVKDGYLKDAKVYLNGLGKNYEVPELESADIDLKQVNSNETLKQIIPLVFNMTDTVDIANLNSISKVTINGTFVSKDGEEEVEEEVDIRINWQDEATLSVTQEYTKYADYKLDSLEGVILQSKVTVSRSEGTNLPIEQTKLVIKPEELTGKKLSKVTVSSINTSGTNGKTLETAEFSEANWNYSEGIITITVKNEANNSEVWAGKGQDEYLVTYIYENETDVEDEKIKVTSDIEVEVKEYNREKALAAKLNEEKEISKTQDIVSYEIKTNIQQMSKGKLYANQIKQTEKYEINYETKAIIDIPYAEVAEDISLEMAEDTLINKEDENLNKENPSYYKTTKISKALFDEMLGDEGYISIINGEKEIARIDGSNIADEEGNYTITYTENFASLKINISQPVKEGNLILVNEKIINKEMIFTDKEIVSLAKLQTNLNEEKAQIEFTEVNSGISVETDKKELSSIAINKDVSISVLLNNREENTLFYKEPVFDIILPAEVESIDVKQSDILYAEGLSIANVQKGLVGDKLAIRVTLSGTQEDFSNGAFSNGTEILIKADIKLKELCPNKEEIVQVKYQNNNPVAALLGVNSGETKTDITLTAPEEVISIQTIKVDDEGNEITSVDNGKVAGKLEIFDEAKTKQMELKVLNNYTVPVGNIFVLGRIPFEGNKSPEGIDMGSTFSTTLKTALTSSAPEAKIYYSENAEATKVLDETWKTIENADLSKVKSYLVVFPEDFTLAPAESLTFTYDFEVPANLEHNAETYGALTTSYRKILSEENKVAEQSKAEFVGLSTGEGPQLKVELSSNVENGAAVREGQKVTYTATVTNTGKNVAENVVVTIKEAEKVNITNSALTIENIEVGQTKSVTFEGTTSEVLSIEDYYTSKGYLIDETGIYLETTDTKTLKGTLTDNKLVVEEDIEEGYEIQDVEVIDESTGEATVTITKTVKEYVTEPEKIYSKVSVEVAAKDLDKNIVSNTVSNFIKETKIEASMNATIKEEMARLGQDMTYEISISSKDEKAVNNVEVEVQAIDEIEYEKIEVQEIDSTTWPEIKTTIIDTIENVEFSNGKVLIPISKLENGKTYTVKIYAKVKENTELEQASITVYSSANIYVEGEIDCSTEKVGVEITKDNITITQTCSNQDYYIKPTENATFTITIKNEGLLNTEIQLKDIIPEILKVNNIVKTYGDSSIESYVGNTIEETITLKPQETIVYKINTSMNYIEETQVGEITNVATIIVNGKEINSNEVKLYAEYVEKPADVPNIPDSGDKEDDTDKPVVENNKISGKVWLDANRDGKYAQGEQLMSNIEVYLINEAGETINTTKTDGNGQYTFENVQEGKYIVAFKYDNTVYNLADYQKDGVSGNENSDVIGKQGTAITDTIEIVNKSIGNIDMGLVEKETFDLRLDKYVSKIVVQTTSGTKEYTQKDETKLAKVEIRAKELKGAKVMMEYELVITNEGKTAGYAKEIVDYMPRDTEFSSELNSGWYLDNDGSLHTTQLKDILIQPGESKTIKVVLSRNMTENNTDTVNNRAEIAISHNQDLAIDEDSVAGNKLNGEDDIGSADIIIGVATGAEVIYITLAIVSMIILGTGMYFIKSKVLVK